MLIKEFDISERDWDDALKYLNYLNSVIDEQEKINSNNGNIRINPFISQHEIGVLLDFIEKSAELYQNQQNII